MNRLTCKEVSRALGIQPTKASQATRDLFRKMALLMRAYPSKTWAHVHEEMAQLDAMSEAELDLRSRLNEGRANTSEIQP